jgi:hypothetical protein
MAESAELTSAIAELDDGYLKAMLLLAVRLASSEDPRRSGFWHALAVALADEQEKRQGAGALGRAAGQLGRAGAPAPSPAEVPELDSVL